jgi:hypothetical protein
MLSPGHSESTAWGPRCIAASPPLRPDLAGNPDASKLPVGWNMFQDYTDITERIAETPKWWDENGVPRYEDFEPRRAANIYAIEVVLLDIACFMCLRRFQVALSGQGGAHRDEKGISLADQIRSGDIDYCDPPNYGNCRDGSSTGCLNLAVLQYWRRDFMRDWERHPSLEIALPEMKDYANHNR